MYCAKILLGFHQFNGLFSYIWRPAYMPTLGTVPFTYSYTCITVHCIYVHFCTIRVCWHVLSTLQACRPYCIRYQHLCNTVLPFLVFQPAGRFPKDVCCDSPFSYHHQHQSKRTTSTFSTLHALDRVNHTLSRPQHLIYREKQHEAQKKPEVLLVSFSRVRHF